MVTSSTNGDIESVVVLPAPESVDPSSSAASKDKVIGAAGTLDEATGEIELMLSPRLLGPGLHERSVDDDGS